MGTMTTAWRPRYGTSNPEKVDINAEYWARTVRARFTREKIEHPIYPPWDDNEEEDIRYDNSAYRERKDGCNGPSFSFWRSGQTETDLPDGRTVYIAGEHEDWYDPDFCIYNDVVVKNAHGDNCDIFLYPRSNFQPTDFHTATLVGNKIFIIGCLGYTDMREEGYTPVYELDLGTMAMKRLDVAGKGPGWLWNHTAEYDEKINTIIVAGGEGLDGNNTSRYALVLGELTWSIVEE